MKILQISTGFDISYSGGITNYVRNLSEELVKDNKIIVLDSTSPLNNEKFSFERIKIENTNLKPFHYKNIISNNDTEKVLKIIDKINPDIIHIHMMLDLPLEILKKLQNKYVTVLSLHDYSWFCNQISLIDIDEKNCLNCLNGTKCQSCVNKFYKNKYARFLIKKSKFIRELSKYAKDKSFIKKIEYMREVFKKFDCVIAVSNRVKELYIENGFENEKFLVNHIGNMTANIEFRKYFLDKEIEAKKKLKLGFIGNFTKNKGADLVIELSKIIENDICIFGRINQEYLNKIKKYKNIKYYGGYNQAELKEILSKIDIGLVMPVWEDNAPQVVFEMQNALIPIIATKMGGIPDFVKDKENGILISPDSIGLKKAKNFLMKITEDNDLKRYKENLKKGTKTPAKHSQEILEIYKELLKNNEKYKK